MLGTFLVFYFAFNVILALILWFFMKPEDVSIVGYFLAMFLFGLVIIVFFIVLFVLALLAGASYNFGDFVQTKMSKHLGR